MTRDSVKQVSNSFRVPNLRRQTICSPECFGKGGQEANWQKKTKQKKTKNKRKQKNAAAETIYHQTRLRPSSQADNFISPSIEISGGDKKGRYSGGLAECGGGAGGGGGARTLGGHSAKISLRRRESNEAHIAVYKQ